MKKLFLLLIFFLFNTSINSQDGPYREAIDRISHEMVIPSRQIAKNNIAPQDTTESIRTVFLSLIGVGFPDFINNHLGYQINNEWSVAIKLDVFCVKERYDKFSWQAGYGICVKRYLQKNILFVFNNIAADILIGVYEKKIEGGMIDLNVGYESTSNFFVNLYFSTGLTCSFYNEFYPLFYPSIRFGLNFNI